MTRREGRFFLMLRDSFIDIRQPPLFVLALLHALAIAIAIILPRDNSGSVVLSGYMLFAACVLSDCFVPFIPARQIDSQDNSLHFLLRVWLFTPALLGGFISLPSVFMFLFTSDSWIVIIVFITLILHFVFCMGVSGFISTLSSNRMSRRYCSAVLLIAFDALVLIHGPSVISVYDLLDATLRGFVNTSSLIVYCIIALAFPLLNIMRRYSNKTLGLRSAVTVLSVILILVIAASHHRPIDLTHDHYYTISPLSRSLLNRLDSELLLTWYRSDLPVSRDPERDEMSVLLDSYSRASRGMFTVDTVRVNSDPPPFPGLKKGGSVIPGRKDIVESYSGIILEYRGRTRIIPFIRDVATLEYNVTRRISELVSAEDPVWFELYQGHSSEHDYYAYLAEYLADSGIIVRNHGSEDNSGGLNRGMLVIGSSRLDDTAVASIRSRLTEGANAIFLVSGVLVNTRGNWSAVPKEDDPLLNMLGELGVSITRSIVLSPPGYTLVMPSLDTRSVKRVSYPYWNEINRDDLPKDHALFSGIESLLFYWPSSVNLAPSVRGISLVKAGSMAVDATPPFDTNPFGEASNLGGTGIVRSPKTLVVSVGLHPHQRILVVTDENLPSSMIEYTGSKGNLDFVANSLEWIAGRDEFLFLKRRRR